MEAGCPSPDAAQRGVPARAAAQRVIVDLEKGDEPGGKHRGIMVPNSWTQESREAYEVKARLLRRGRPASRASSGRTEAPAVDDKAHANNQHPLSGSPPAVLSASAARLGAGFLSGSV